LRIARQLRELKNWVKDVESSIRFAGLTLLASNFRYERGYFYQVHALIVATDLKARVSDAALKPESLRSRGWATAVVGFLFLAVSLLVSWSASQNNSALSALNLTFLVLVGITGATLVLAGILIVMIGYQAEIAKR
jgi:hypothetical protein